MENQAKWYVLHTYSGYENMVKENIEKMVELNNLSDFIFELKIPMEQTIEEKNGKRKVVMRRLYPCYVFIKMIHTNNIWYMVTNTRGVTSFIGPGGRPLPLVDDEVKRMQLEKTVSTGIFATGDNVKILSGPLEAYFGVIESLDEKAQKAKIIVSMFGRSTPVELEYFQFEKI